MKNGLFTAHTLVLLLATMLASSLASAKQPIEVITFELPPYQRGDGLGLGERVVRAAMLTQGIELTFNTYPRKRASGYFLQGKGDAYMGPGYDIRGEEYLSEEIGHARQFLVISKNKVEELKFRTLADLRGRTIGFETGSLMGDVFDSAGLISETTPSISHNLQKLELGRIDLVYSLGLTLENELRAKYPDGNHPFHLTQFNRISGSMNFRNTDQGKEWFGMFKKGLRVIIDDGTYIAILESYYGEGHVPKSVIIEGPKPDTKEIQ